MVYPQALSSLVFDILNNFICLDGMFFFRHKNVNKLLKYSQLYGILLLSKIKKELNCMKKIICKVEYDTETSTEVAKFVSGEFGDPAGYEESLYVKADGKYFLYTNGGEDSIYKTENIARMSAAKAQQWLEEHKA